MKVPCVLIASLAAGVDIVYSLSVRENEPPRLTRVTRQAVRRYSQVQEQISSWTQGNYDERDLWGYGCHCNFVGDRPLSDMGIGQPKDEIDSLCKRYHQCLMCARKSYGNMCIGEFVEYGLEASITCTDEADTCGRSLCECDSAFAQEYAMLLQDGVEHNDDINRFFSEPEWRKEEHCERTGYGNGGQLECCRSEDKTTPFFMINKYRQTCCKDGTTTFIGGCEEATEAPPTLEGAYGRK